jgi:uncharacterized lipoprotein YmbA
MNVRMAMVFRVMVAGGGLWAVSGCALLREPRADPTRFYVLAAPVAAAAPVAGAPGLQLRPVEVASYLRGRSLIVRRGEHEIEFRDYARWGEPLEQGIGRVLREELRARGVAGTPASAVRAEAAGSDLLLVVRLLACEGAADGTVLFRATWELSQGGAAPGGVGAGDYRATGLRWDGKGEALLVARLSDAVAGLAAEIAGKLAKR